MRYIVLALVTLTVLVNGQRAEASTTEKFQRDPNDFSLAKEKVESSIVKLEDSGPPKTVVIGSDGSTFDLSMDGRMHLEWGGKYVLVYQLKYLGNFGDVVVCREMSPDGWIWYFYPDGRLYYFTKDSGPHLYDSKANFYEKLP